MSFEGERVGLSKEHLMCYYDQKLTAIFFHKSKVLMFNTYHAKLQVFMSTIISGFGRPAITKFKYGREQLRKLGREGK